MTRTIVGVDNYSYHRYLGEVRPGERATGEATWPWPWTLTAAAAAGADAIALETCFMTPGECRMTLPAVPDVDCMLSWGHPYGLEYGESVEALEDALAWLALASELGHRRMRVTIAHPHLRESDGWSQVRRSVASVARLAEAAAASSVRLGIENHADVTSEQLAWILAEVDSPALGVCFDTANAVRVGDDPLRAAEALADHVIAAHVKDVAADPWHPRSGPRSVPLGTGVLPIASILDVLHRARPDAWYLVELAQLGDHEVDEQAWIARDVGWLRECLSA